MPNPEKGARLYLRKRKGRPSTYVIRDSGGLEISTQCGAGDRAGAEEALAVYIREKYVPPQGQRDPTQARIADMLTHYLSTHAPSVSDPAREATAAGRLLDHFGEMVVDRIDRQSCARYVEGRDAATGTARRELETLQAALRLAQRDKLLTVAPHVFLPQKSQPRDRWLTKDEADRLLTAAEAMPKGAAHVSTFIRIGLMTGTRRTAILKLQWQENLTGGHVDLANGMLYRKPRHAAETRKRQPPIRIPEPLLPFLAAQRERTRQYVIEYRGQPIARIGDGLKIAGKAAGVDGVTPHVLRHTCCTWLAQDGVPIWEAAGLVGMSPNEFQRTYAHHHPDHMGGAQAAIGRRWE